MADRTRLPVAGADAPFVFPRIQKTALSSGLSLWHVPHAAVPVTTMVLLVRAGSSADPEDRPGLASLTGDMLDEGAGDRTAIEVHEALTSIGAQFDTEVGADATFLTLTNHFFSASSPLPQGRAMYAGMIERAEMVGFNLYPLQTWCRRATLQAVRVWVSVTIARMRGKPLPEDALRPGVAWA